MMNYLLYRGMGMGTVGLWRGISSSIGLSGTFIYQYSTYHSSLRFTGMLSISFQFICISWSMASMFVSDYTLSMIWMIGGVCTSLIAINARTHPRRYSREYRWDPKFIECILSIIIVRIVFSLHQSTRFFHRRSSRIHCRGHRCNLVCVWYLL